MPGRVLSSQGRAAAGGAFLLENRLIFTIVPILLGYCRTSLDWRVTRCVIAARQRCMLMIHALFSSPTFESECTQRMQTQIYISVSVPVEQQVPHPQPLQQLHAVTHVTMRW